MKKWRILILTLVIVLSFVFVSAVYADTTYVVRYGDTLWRISRIYGTTPEAIKAANSKITDINIIFAGDFLVIPTADPPGDSGTGGGGPYVIQYGDTLYNIAWRYGTTVNAILVANPQIKDPNWIYAGHTLTLPAVVTGGGAGGNPEPIPESGIYIVQPGDGLTGIGRRYGLTVDALLILNPQIKNRDLIFVGDQVKLR